ncbi:MAG: hypothetical protein JRN68_06365 [Nitrososphaerota archaeon]|nr:hypothetical protein [Nitrososphaerota archaeon]
MPPHLNARNRQPTEITVTRMTTPLSTTTDEHRYDHTYAIVEATNTARMPPWNTIGASSPPSRSITTERFHKSPENSTCPSNADNTLSNPNFKPNAMHDSIVYTTPKLRLGTSLADLARCQALATMSCAPSTPRKRKPSNPNPTLAQHPPTNSTVNTDDSRSPS